MSLICNYVTDKRPDKFKLTLQRVIC